MKKQNSLYERSVVYLSTLFCLSTLIACAPNSTSPDQAKNSGSPDEKICTDNQAEVFAELEPEVSTDGLGDRSRPVMRRRSVRVNFDVIKPRMKRAGSRATLNLFRDRRVEIEITDTSESGGVTIAHGRIPGKEGSEVTLAMKDDVLLGHVQDNDSNEHFEISTNSDGRHVVEAIAETEADCIAVPVPEAEVTTSASEGDISPQAVAPVIDMLVAYTPAALTKLGSVKAMEALIRMGIADTNAALTASGVGYSVRLVGMMKVSSNETSNFSSDLTALKSKTDSKWNEVHTERARLGADQVTLIGAYNSNTTTAGIGYVGASAASAFTIVKSNQFGQYTFSHELGHNIGLNHSDGYQNTSGRFRTIMAYGTYKRVKRFSSASLTYNGYKTGDSAHNSAAILNSRVPRTAALVPQVIPTAPTPAPSTPKPTATPQSPAVVCP